MNRRTNKQTNEETNKQTKKQAIVDHVLANLWFSGIARKGGS